MEPKRARTHAATADNDEECEKHSCDGMNLADCRHEAIRIQNRRSNPLGSRAEVQTPQGGQAGSLEHSRLGLVGWIAYWILARPVAPPDVSYSQRYLVALLLPF